MQPRMFCFDLHRLDELIKTLKQAQEEYLKGPQFFRLCPQCAKDLKPLQKELNEFLRILGKF